METLKLIENASTRQVNAAFREGFRQAYREMFDHLSSSGIRFASLTADERRDRVRHYVAPGVRADKPSTRYVFGFHTPFRDTLSGHYEVGSGEVYVAFPAAYRGWGQSDTYTQFRVIVHDRIGAELRKRGLLA